MNMMTDLFFNSQYGLRENHSTQHAILDILRKTQNNMDKGVYSCGIFIDLKQVFDRVGHSILLYKLHHHGNGGIINNWFASYLSGRTQKRTLVLLSRGWLKRVGRWVVRRASCVIIGHALWIVALGEESCS